MIVFSLRSIQVPVPDRYRGKFTERNSPGKDIGLLYANEVKSAIDKVHKNGHKIAAYYSESLQSCGGQIMLPPGYLKNVYK